MKTTDLNAPLLSIVTVCLDSAATVGETLTSVDTVLQGSRGDDVEHLIVDGLSKDGTLAIMERHHAPYRQVVSEKDTGLYNAMNKGLGLARGKYIWFLNSDDLLDPSAAQWFPEMLNRLRSRAPRALVGQIRMFHDVAGERCLTRAWRLPSNLRNARRLGWHPPHPAFIAERLFLAELGGFDETKRIAADFKLMISAVDRSPLEVERFLHNMTLMREGGVSNANTQAILRANLECFRAQRELGRSAMGAGVAVALKLSRKILQTLDLSNRKLVV
jgi:Glycosyl transferase family 2